MGRYVRRKCKGSVGEIAVIHHHHHPHHHHHHHDDEVGVITRARARAMAKRKSIDALSEEEEVVVRVNSRRRRVRIITPDVDQDDESDIGVVNVSDGGGNSQVNSARCSSTNGSSSEEAVRRCVDADLNEVEGIEFESSASSSFSEYCTERSRRETNRLSELISSEFEEDHHHHRHRHHQDPSMESSIGSLSHNASSTTAKKEKNKKTSAAEIEDFLSAMEKESQERFAEKYNYDIVKDVPLEGRYEWVQLKP